MILFIFSLYRSSKKAIMFIPTLDNCLIIFSVFILSSPEKFLYQMVMHEVIRLPTGELIYKNFQGVPINAFFFKFSINCKRIVMLLIFIVKYRLLAIIVPKYLFDWTISTFSLFIINYIIVDLFFLTSIITS